MTTKKTGMTIWVSNSCGELFIFNNVPDDPLECGWWEDNNISEVVGNNQNSCEWGAFYGEAKITHIKTPFGGWKEGETKCDNKCGCVLGIDVPIMCWQKGDEEMTLCSECYYDAGFWKDDENPDNEDEIREHKEDESEDESDDESEEECEVCCLTDCACVIVSAARTKGHTTENCVKSVVNAMELIREVMVSSRNAATVNDSKLGSSGTGFLGVVAFLRLSLA
jgi:hypothetical protein